MNNEQIELTDDLLEYVDKIAIHHCPDIEPDDEGNMCAFPSVRATFKFKDRYNNNELTNEFSFADYLKSSNIQSTLKAFKLDPLKFWLLILYIYDYTYCACSIGVKYDTPKKQIDKFLDAVVANISEMNKDGLTFKQPMTLTLEIKGKHKVVIDNSYALTHITKLCVTNENWQDGNILIADRKVITDKEKIEETQEVTGKRICYFAELFISFFEGIPINKTNKIKGVDYDKLLFIARIVYLARFVFKEDYDQDDLKGVLSKYKGQKLNRWNNIYT